MSGEWEDPIEHDGGPAPRRYGTCVLSFPRDDLIKPEAGVPVKRIWPGWSWRMRRVRIGMFRSVLRPVCDNPAYSPILAYRFRKPPRATVSTAAELIRECTHPLTGSPAGAYPASSLSTPGGAGRRPAFHSRRVPYALSRISVLSHATSGGGVSAVEAPASDAVEHTPQGARGRPRRFISHVGAGGTS